ncbi:MAG: putative rane protein [Microbacteriaceae bacterium]|nr:putative rane protein [Microbacteriaceae bacterium]
MLPLERTVVGHLIAMSDDHPELTGYEPGDHRPLRSPHVVLVMRILVVLGIIALVLPGIVTTMSVGANTANTSCARWVALEKPEATGSSARFEMFGPGGVGWQCYSVGAFGGDELVASLGIIPNGSRLPVPVSNT